MVYLFYVCTKRRQIEMTGHPVVNVVIKAQAQFLGGLVD